MDAQKVKNVFKEKSEHLLLSTRCVFCLLFTIIQWIRKKDPNESQGIATATATLLLHDNHDDRRFKYNRAGVVRVIMDAFVRAPSEL